MANITIGGGGSMFKDAIPSALQFASWDNYKWFQQGGQGLNISNQNFNYSPISFHLVQDTENKKFFALPQGKGSNASYKLGDQKPLGCYKYDHQTDQCIFIEFDKNDIYTLRNKITQNSYENLFYDETTNRLFFINLTTKEMWEIDQTTGRFTQKTTCIVAGTICGTVCSNGYIYAIDSSKNFVRYNITTGAWSALATMGGSASLSQSYCRLLTDGTCVVFVPYQNMQTTGYELMKYSIAGNTWSVASVSNAPTSSNYYISEIFNGYVYVHYLSNTNNYSMLWKYSLSGNSWTANPFNLQSKGMLNGGAWGMFRANNKLYWYGSKYYQDTNSARSMQKPALWEMDTAENFTETAKYVPVEFGNWCYELNYGYENDMMQVQKSCARYQIYNSFHANSRGYRYFPYIDPTAKTVEWIKVPTEANKEKDWQGWAAVVKNGKLYMMDAKNFDLFVCTIGVWTWTKLDNLFTRLGNKMPFSYNANPWMYGCAPNSVSQGATPWQGLGGLFTVKEDAEDIFLVCPRYSSETYCYVYKFDVSANQWSILNANGDMPNAYWGQSSHSTYGTYKNHVVVSNQNSSWLLFLCRSYDTSNNQRFNQYYYAFNPVDGTFEAINGQNTTSWYGTYGFTLDGKPIWHTNSSYNKVYYNDMATMAYDISNKLLEQVLDNQDQYLYVNVKSYQSFIFNIDPQNFEKGFAITVASSETEGGVYQEWGFEQQINAPKGGYLLGWTRNTSLGTPSRYGRIIIDNDGVRSSIVNDALPDSVVDSATVFTTKVKKNFKLYLEQWCSSNGLVTFFAPIN
ncbi:hypothetical protein IPN35_01980 [Candidatus Peregrinibacteria bacterium]|nr:MAG: hypothetical protein IPN35_01980 [Candidatus Peregrinibacteria bacterium]